MTKFSAKKNNEKFIFSTGIVRTGSAGGSVARSVALPQNLATAPKEGNIDDVFCVNVPVTDTGSVSGKEVVQLYVSDLNSSVDRPVKEFKGLSKIDIAPGETTMVTIPVKGADLGYFDVSSHQWIVEPGEFDALVGASSADIHGKVRFKVN